MAKNSKNSKATTEAPERERKSWLENVKAKMHKAAVIAEKVAGSEKADKAGQKAATALVASMKTFGEWLATLPPEFRLSLPQSSSRQINEGDDVFIVDEMLPMYEALGKGPHKVLKVYKFGGNAENGRGAKVFVTVESKRTGQLSLPSTVLE